MNLSKRIKALIEMVPNDKPVADIGSDHGYLLIGLCQKGFNKQCLGVENKIGPYKHLVENIKKENFTNIETSLSSGLTDVNEKFKTIVIAGMGFQNICQIINDNIEKISFIEDFIIDSHNNTYELRKYLSNLGFYIFEEKCLIENEIFYELIHFKKGTRKYSELELKYGPFLLKEKNEDFINYYSKVLNKKEEIITNKFINKQRINELIIEINELKVIL